MIKLQAHMIVLILLIASCLGQRYNWTKPADINRGLPPSVEVYILNMTNSPFGTKLTGGFARFNMNDTNL